MAQTATGPTGIGIEGPLRPFAASKTLANATGGITISPPARSIRVATAGTIVGTYATGVVDTITFQDGELLDLALVSIDAASTAAGITVFW